jgi:hypothetical protein
MAGKLKDLWKNRKQIMEGIKNSIIRDEFVEEVSSERMNICTSCIYKDVEGSECLVAGTQPCCSLCGCSLEFKTRALSSECPDNRWAALLSEEEEDQLDNLKD